MLANQSRCSSPMLGGQVDWELPKGVAATDLVLTVTQMLRRHGVVGSSSSSTGPGVSKGPAGECATIGNMSPEYGSTCAIFPIDEQTLSYLEYTGRPPELIALVEADAKEQGAVTMSTLRSWHSPTYSSSTCPTVEPSLAGPARPLRMAKRCFRASLAEYVPQQGSGERGAQAGHSMGTTVHRNVV
jgi:aconitate hydratase